MVSYSYVLGYHFKWNVFLKKKQKKRGSFIHNLFIDSSYLSTNLQKPNVHLHACILLVHFYSTIYSP